MLVWGAGAGGGAGAQRQRTQCKRQAGVEVNAPECLSWPRCVRAQRLSDFFFNTWVMLNLAYACMSMRINEL